MPSVAELRAIAQPASIFERNSGEHWAGRLYVRRLSPYLTRPLLAAGASANAVTGLMILAGALAGVATGWPGLAGAVLAALLVQLQMLLDCCDGEVARWRGTSSPVGIYLDRVGHYVAECGIALGLGVRVAAGDGRLGIDEAALTGGALLALLVALNKVENDLVHVSRAQAGMAAVRDAEEVRAPRGGALRTARRVARLIPFHRMFHSVELSLLVLFAAVSDTIVTDVTGAADRPVTTGLLILLLGAVAVTVVGHLIAVLASPRLR
jgi:phosphatidylglycerophosphate synthase